MAAVLETQTINPNKEIPILLGHARPRKTTLARKPNLKGG
jgi:hypothetical protein